MAIEFEKTYSQEEFRNLLTTFQNDIQQNKYNERIPYKAWRNFNKANKIHVMTHNLFVEVSAFLSDDWCTECQKYKIYDFGFGRFFYDHVLTAPGSTWNKSNNDEKKKENNTMKMPNMNFDFGPFTGKEVAVSPYGIAVRNKDGEYLAYNAASGSTINVTGFTFDFQQMIYKMPVAVKDLRAGDMIMHCGKPMYIQNADDSKNIQCIDILNSESKVVVPVTNIFGFNFVTKVVSFMNIGAAQPSADNPFGNLMPFMMMSSIMGEDSGSDSNSDFSKMMMMSMMMGGSNPLANMLTPQDK